MAIPIEKNSKDEARLKNIVDGTNELFWQHAENIDDSSLRPINYFEAGDENKHLVPGAPHLSSTTAIDSDSGHLLPKIDGSIASHSNYFKRGKKRKEAKSQEQHVTVKKQRLVWTSKLHSMFVRVVHRLGVESAVPKKILENMRRSGAINLTRENVASHLQKYRLFLRRKENKDHGKMSNIPSQSVSLNGSKESNFKQTSITDEALYIENGYNYDSFDHLPLQNLGIDIVSPHDQIMLPYSRNVLSPLDQNILQDSKSHILESRRPSHDTSWCVHGGMIETFESLPTLSNLQPKLENEVHLLPGDDMIYSNFPNPHPPIMSVQYDVVDENHLSDIRSGSVDMSPWLNDFLDESLSNFIDNHGNVHVGGYGNANETNFYVSNSSHGALDSYLEREFEAKFNPFVNHPDNASN